MSDQAKILLGIGLASLVLLGAAVFLLGRSSTPTPTSTATADPSLLYRSDSYQTASPSAKLNLVEFGDYQCPACGAAHPIVKQLLKDEPKLNLIFRNFPLPQHQNAQIAAEAAEAAGAQGKYWQMHDLLYENQDSWSGSKDPLSIFIDYANKIGLDTNKFKEDVTQNKFANKIQRDVQDGNTLGVNSTPTFYLNGQKVEGIPSYADFKNLVDKLN